MCDSPTADDCAHFAPFVIFGASKSGTTWLQRVCDAHPEVRCHFQLPILPFSVRRIARPAAIVHNARRSPFNGVFASPEAENQYQWKLQLLERVELLRDGFVQRRVRVSSDEQRRFLEELQYRMIRGVVRELLCDDPGKKIFGTKAYTDLDLLFRVFPQAKLIHIVRDGRDVCVSRRFHTLRMGVYYLGDERNALLGALNRWKPSRMTLLQLGRRLGLTSESWFQAPTDGRRLFTRAALEKFAADWKGAVEYIASHVRRHPGRCVTIRYEDMLARPREALRQVFSHLEADTSDEVLDLVIAQTSFSASKKKAGRASFFRGGRSGDWRQHFHDEDVALFKSIAGRALIDLGYEADDNWG